MTTDPVASAPHFAPAYSTAPSLAAAELRDAHAEAACIACALAHQDYALDVIAIPADFFICGENRVIVQVMYDLWQRGSPINFITLKDELVHRRDGQQTLLERVGGVQGLSAFRSVKIEEGGIIRATEDDSGVFATLKEAIEIVKNYGAARKLVDSLGDVRMELIGKSVRPVDAVVLIRSIITASDMAVTTYARSDSEDYHRYKARLDDLGKGLIMGMPTGFKGFDQQVGGLYGGQMLLISAARKNAKSALALAIADYCVRGNIPAAIFTTEMRADEIRDRRTVMRAGGLLELDFFKGGLHPVNQRELGIMHEVWDMISKEPFYIIPFLNDADLALMEAERLIIQKGVKVLIFDFLQNFTAEGKDERQALNHISQGTKNLVNKYAEWGVVVIDCNQLNSKGIKDSKENAEPSSDDTHMGSGPTKDADVLTTVWLEDQEYFCACKVQTKPKEFRKGRQIVEREVPLWEAYPAGGECNVCESKVQWNPIRRGRWKVEGGRSTRQNTEIWFEFNGTTMNFKQLGRFS